MCVCVCVVRALVWAVRVEMCVCVCAVRGHECDGNVSRFRCGWDGVRWEGCVWCSHLDWAIRICVLSPLSDTLDICDIYSFRLLFFSNSYYIGDNNTTPQ